MNDPVNHDDDDDIILPNPESQTVVDEPVVLESDEVIVGEPNEDPDDSIADNEDVILPKSEDDEVSEEVLFPENKIDLRGESQDLLGDIATQQLESLGRKEFEARVRQVGSWENIVFRAINENLVEEYRIQEAIAALSEEDRQGMSHRYRRDGKNLLKTAAIGSRNPAKGEVKVLSGTDALIAFESAASNNTAQLRGGGYRIPLYNSGITVDVMAPTGTDIQTMINSCVILDMQLGAAHGLHYFAYNDQLYKEQILRFLKPLIIDSSYTDWRKGDKLWSVIKLPDLQALVMTIAAICHRNGFENFLTKCTRKPDETHPNQCTYTETITINLFEMIVTRFAALGKESVDFMVDTHRSGKSSTLVEIAQYQAGLGLEGETITFDNLTFTMRIPTLQEHLDAGSQFLADITNEIQGDNNEGRYDQIGFRYIRTFLPWIANVEATTATGGIIKTADPAIILRQLETVNDIDKDSAFRKALEHYVNKVQLTYVGYPVVACPVCDHVAETPSGMRTIDPFSAFFIIASLYLTRE